MHRRTVPNAPRSPAQIQASQANGALSRGPATIEGKAVASRNAMKHGLSAHDTPVASGEDEAAYKALLARLIERFEPQEEMAMHLVERLASIIWRTNRADIMESDIMSIFPSLSRRRDRMMLAEFDAQRLHVLMRHHRELENAFLRTLSALQTVQGSFSQNEPTNANSFAVSRA